MLGAHKGCHISSFVGKIHVQSPGFESGGHMHWRVVPAQGDLEIGENVKRRRLPNEKPQQLLRTRRADGRTICMAQNDLAYMVT